MAEHTHHHADGEVSDARLLGAVALNLGLTVLEAAAGFIAGSVALLADALHNFNDCGTLIVAYIARKVSRRPASRRFTFGHRRAELIGAMINLTTLVVIGLFLGYEAIERLLNPQAIQGWWVIGAASVALVVDVATAWLLFAMSRGSLNVRAAFIHNLADAAASVGVLLAGVAVLIWDARWVDPVLSLVIAGYLLYQGVTMLRATARILMEGTPEEVSIDEVVDRVEETPGVQSVHHVHVWQLDESHRALEAHIMIDRADAARLAEIKAAVKRGLEESFDIGHSTLEFEFPDEADASHPRDVIVAP